ncbi:MAG: restriction endonuclease subunit S [Candidatus Schmidhempelia sp.]|nr:restriction endonuclease subunit S [Candidatus Schmidhempelia sp.]
MSKNELRQLGTIAIFNPPERVSKGDRLKKVPMEYLTAWQKKITGFILSEYKSGSKFRNGDVLLAKITPCLENGKTAYVNILNKNEIGFGSTEFIVLRATEDLDSHYLYYLTISPTFRKKAISCMEGTSGRKRVNENALKRYEVLIPAKIEQKKISNFLNLLDKKIELNNQINAELESMAKTLYDYWFVQFDFSDENGKPYKSSGGKMVYNSVLKREIPDGWNDSQIVKIENNIITGKTPPKENSDYFSGDVPFITIGDIRGNTFIVHTEETLTRKGADFQKNKYLPEDTICVTCIATPGLIGLTTTLSQTNQQINSIICSKEYHKYFLYFTLKGYFNANSKVKIGNTFANMNKKDFSEIELIYPSENLLINFHKKVSSIFEKIKSNTKESNKLSKLRDFLLPMLMNGQVTIKD